MNLQQTFEALYAEALRLKQQAALSESQLVEERAARFLEEVESRAERDEDDPATAEALLFLAERQWPIEGDSDGVRAKLQRALSIRESHFGKDHEAVAEALTKMAEFHLLAGRWDEAAPLSRRAIAILEQGSQGGDAVYAQALAGLAQALAGLGRAEEADAVFQRAIDEGKKPHGNKRALYFLYLQRAQGLETLGRAPEAEALRQDAQTLLPRANPGEFGYQA